MPRELTQAIVEQWIDIASGSFNVRDIWAELDIKSPTGKQHLRVCLNRLEAKKIIVKTSKDGFYRKVDLSAKPIDWQNADPSKTIPLVLPFGIHELCKVFPKSIIIVAGEKQQGKTAFLYQCIKLNMAGSMIIDLFNSETGPEQMKERFAPLDIPEPAPFNVFERYDNFADVIHPEHLSVIDYLDFNSEVYMVGAEIDAIFRKITGVAIIGLQKPPPTVTYIKGQRKEYSRDLAYGGAFTAKRAILYITMGSNKLKLLYVKTPANPKINPNNMQWSYSFDESGYFTNIQRYYGDEPGF